MILSDNVCPSKHIYIYIYAWIDMHIYKYIIMCNGVGLLYWKRPARKRSNMYMHTAVRGVNTRFKCEYTACLCVLDLPHFP